jgi:hypothetical protein
MRYPNGSDTVTVKPHFLMARGKCALWRNGRVIWIGSLGEPFEDVDFDAITVSVEDFERIKAGAVQ